MSARLALAVAALLGTAACLGSAGTETGNPPLAAVQLALAAPDVPVRTALTADPATGVRIDEVWISIDRVKFEQAASCDRDPGTEADVRGPLAVELARAPQLLEVQLAAADYCRVRVRLGRADPGPGVPELLEDHAVLVTGVRGDGTPFAIRSRLTPDVDVRSRGAPFPLGEGRDAVLLAFDAKRWLAAVDLDAAAVSDGAILVDDSEQRELLSAFEAAIVLGLSLHEDGDSDGELDDAEADALASSR